VHFPNSFVEFHQVAYLGAISDHDFRFIIFMKNWIRQMYLCVSFYKLTCRLDAP